MSSTNVPTDISTPLNIIWDVYYEAASWFPRPAIKLITHHTAKHPESWPDEDSTDPLPDTNQDLNVYTIYGRIDDYPKAPVPLSLLPSTISLTALHLGSLDEEPSPYPKASLDKLANSHIHSYMCDFSVQAFLPTLRTIFKPHGIVVNWFQYVPCLDPTTGAFLLTHYRAAANGTVDPNSTEATDSLIFAEHSVFMISVPDKSQQKERGDEENSENEEYKLYRSRVYKEYKELKDIKWKDYIADFSLEQYGIEHEGNWLLPKEEYLKRFAFNQEGRVVHEEPSLIPDSQGLTGIDDSQADYGRGVEWWRAVGLAVANMLKGEKSEGLEEESDGRKEEQERKIEKSKEGKSVVSEDARKKIMDTAKAAGSMFYNDILGEGATESDFETVADTA